MKSKNIPHDITTKSIKDAQSEIKQIIEKLEETGAKLEDSMTQYNRMIQLNNYIHAEFKKKANQIKKSIPHKKKKVSLKNKK